MSKWLAAAMIALAGCGSVETQAGSTVDLTILDRTTGEHLSQAWHRGRSHIAGTPGHKYSIVMTNRTPGRILVVLSVDGINAVTGQTASPGQSGYVLDPYGSLEVGGWRKSMDEVAAFYFTALPDSYAARTERPDHVGVIGVAAFREWMEPRAAELSAPRAAAPSSADSASGAGRADNRAEGASRMPAQKEKLGTGHGEREQSSARYTEFRRASSAPAEVVSIYYDSRENLIAAGILPGRYRPQSVPQPFPGHFVADPS